MLAFVRFNIIEKIVIDKKPSDEELKELSCLVKKKVNETIIEFIKKVEQGKQTESDYNAKIVCTNPKASKVFEKGKVYNVVNGYIYHKGKPIEQPRFFENFEELQDHAIAEFVELIDE